MDAPYTSAKRFTASGDLQRKAKSTVVGGYTGVDIENKYVNYEQMSLMSPHIFVPLHKVALNICKKYRFESKNGKTELIKDFDSWAKRINFKSKTKTLVRLSCRNGTYIALWDSTKSDPNFMTFEPLIMSKTTIIPKGFNPDDPSALTDVILQNPINQFWVNEGAAEKKNVFKYNPEDIVYIALYPYDYTQKDIKDRETYGLYGISLLESIVDIFNKYMDIIEGFATFVKKYGEGRYHINYKALEDMVKDGNIKGAITALNELKLMHSTIMANEDIVSSGCEIKTLDTGNGGLSVTDFKQSLENDIEIGLMQMPLTMGKGEGSTYASGYISESDRVLCLEGLQEEFASMINEQIIKPRALKLGSDELTWQDDIELVFDELSEVNVPLADLIQAYINDILERDEVREFIDMGPAKSDIKNGVNPVLIQQETAEKQMQNQQEISKQNASIQAQSAKSQGRPEVGGKSNIQKKTESAQQSQEKKSRTFK